jgi:hypothetical protein
MSLVGKVGTLNVNANYDTPTFAFQNLIVGAPPKMILFKN